MLPALVKLYPRDDISTFLLCFTPRVTLLWLQRDNAIVFM